MSVLKLGVIGLSEGNGHPYSWSAIFNGYDPAFMKDCPFPVIPDYLAKQQFPQDSLGDRGIVTHVWCQDHAVAEHIAAAANIAHAVSEPQNMIGNVDAVLLARDDAEHHYEMALPFLKAGIPIFIDKPLALSVAEANKMWDAQQYPNQLFSCSSLRYANELLLTTAEQETIGNIKIVEGSVMKKWETYAIHTLEPILIQIPQRGKLLGVKSIYANGVRQVLVQWENVTGYFKTTGNIPAPLQISFFGERGNLHKTFADSFNAFKNSLKVFTDVIKNPATNIPQEETLELVTILEAGLK